MTSKIARLFRGRGKKDELNRCRMGGVGGGEGLMGVEGGWEVTSIIIFNFSPGNALKTLTIPPCISVSEVSMR